MPISRSSRSPCETENKMPEASGACSHPQNKTGLHPYPRFVKHDNHQSE